MKYWTTADGKQIKYKDLEDSHLRNIIRDGYRNPLLVKEAKKRGVPTPKTVKPDIMSLVMFNEACHSCGIEGIKSPTTDAFVKAFEGGKMEKAVSIYCVLHNRNNFDNA